MSAARTSSRRAVAMCGVLVVALFAVVALAPLPFVIAQPGTTTANVLGEHKNKPVITISGKPTRLTTGQLRMTTIEATGPDTEIRLGDVVDSWFRTDRAVMPREAVYPSGQSDRQIEQHNVAEMKKSQDAAADAALRYLHLSPKDVKVELSLADVGGPSAGLLFSLGIIDKLAGDGRAGDLTGGRVIAGTGTISPEGEVGAVGGVSLKTQAAARDGATVFLVPKGECSDAKAELPKGMRLVPVTSLGQAVEALKTLKNDGGGPTC